MAEGQSKMTQSKETQVNPKIEVQYVGDESFMADKIILEFNDDRKIFLIEYDARTERLVARFLNRSPNSDENNQEPKQWALDKEEFRSGNIKFRIVIGQSLWRFQRIKKQIDVTEIRGVLRKLSSNQIVYEYAAPMSAVSKIEIVNRVND
jgi:hypothetical protein